MTRRVLFALLIHYCCTDKIWTKQNVSVQNCTTSATETILSGFVTTTSSYDFKLTCYILIVIHRQFVKCFMSYTCSSPATEKKNQQNKFKGSLTHSSDNINIKVLHCKSRTSNLSSLASILLIHLNTCIWLLSWVVSSWVMFKSLQCEKKLHIFK